MTRLSPDEPDRWPDRCIEVVHHQSNGWPVSSRGTHEPSNVARRQAEKEARWKRESRDRNRHYAVAAAKDALASIVADDIEAGAGDQKLVDDVRSAHARIMAARNQ